MAQLTLTMDGDKMCIAFFKKKIKKYTFTGISISDCKLSPNEFGDIYNPNNVEIIRS
jgi:hypothetical protein